MKTILLIISITIISLQSAFPQIEEMREKMQDQMTEAEEGKLTLRFINAEDGEPVANAAVAIEGLDSYSTDLQGRVLFEPPDDGHYAMKFEKRGFIPATFEFDIMAGTIFYNRFSVSPVIDVGNIRIALDWDNRPDDLDAHFVKEGGYHISYRDMAAAADGKAVLDRDDRDGFGPETITIKDIDENAEYKYYVKDYTNRNREHSKQLSKSKARVKVYGEGQLLKEFMLNEKLKGNSWMVFRIVNGQIVSWDEVNNYY